MAKRNSNAAEMIVPIVLIGVVCLIAVLYFSQSVLQESTSIVSRASRSTFLTPGDDALSLEEDLRRLEEDPAAAAEAELNAIE